MKQIFSFVFFLFFMLNSLIAETLVLRSGKSIDGKIIEQTSDVIVIVEKKGTKRSISKRIIFKVLYNASDKEKNKVEENAKAILEREKAAKDALAAEELRKLEEERLRELEALLEKNRIPVGESEETMMEYKRRIGELETRVKDMEDFMGRNTDWRAYYSTPRSEWDLVKRSALIPGWGHTYAREDKVGSTYTSLFFTSLALTLVSREGVKNRKNDLAADAVEITVIDPIFRNVFVGLTPATSQEAIGNLFNYQAYNNINKFQKDTSEYNQLKQASGNLENITIALYFGQLVHSYFTGRSWAELNKRKFDEGTEGVSLEFKTLQEPNNPLSSAHTRPSRLEMEISYRY